MPDHLYELISYGDLPGGRATEVRRVSDAYTPKFLLPLSAIGIEERFTVRIGKIAGQCMMRVRIPDHIARSRGLDPQLDAPREGWEPWSANLLPRLTPVSELESGDTELTEDIADAQL